MNDNQKATQELLKSFSYIVKESLKRTTKIYDGFVISPNGDKWNVQYNGENHTIKSYGIGTPKANTVVKVVVPQGNQSLAWFSVPFDISSAKKEWLDYAHPVGSWYHSDDPTSPAEMWGGKWLQRFNVTLVAAGDKFAVGSEGGEISHKMTVDELPAHRHTTYTKIYGAQGGYGHTEPTQICDNNDLQYGGPIAQSSESTGGSQAMNLMQPYYATYFWQRMPDDWTGEL